MYVQIILGLYVQWFVLLQKLIHTYDTNRNQTRASATRKKATQRI